MNKDNFDYFIDVRTEEELKEGSAPGSINIPLQKIESDFENTQLSKISKDKKILLVCGGGKRAGIAKDDLESKGFLNIENGGGWESFK